MITVCDVGPRDGLQNENDVLPPETRAELVNRLAATGLPRIEAVSFVRDDAVPQMAGAEEVVDKIERRDGVEYAGLVLNEKGFERFPATGLDRMNMTLAATESFNQRNANASLEEAKERASRIVSSGRRRRRSRSASRSAARSRVAWTRRRRRPRPALPRARGRGDRPRRHDRRRHAEAGRRPDRGNQRRRLPRPQHEEHGLRERDAALEAGATTLDASIGGLGGCPFAPARDREHRDRGPGLHARGRRRRDRGRRRRADRHRVAREASSAGRSRASSTERALSR